MLLEKDTATSTRKYRAKKKCTEIRMGEKSIEYDW